MFNTLEGRTEDGTFLPSNIICFSPIRWNQKDQRPQQIMRRLSQYSMVHFIEEPVYDATEAYLSHTVVAEHIHVFTPHLPGGISEEKCQTLQRALLDQFMRDCNFADYTFWYATPVAFAYSKHYCPSVIVYDCLEDIWSLKLPAEKLHDLEQQLLDRADLVFTSSHTQYWNKKDRNNNVHLLPATIDRAHFDCARGKVSEAEEQEHIPYPRLGYMGIVDDRLDTQLLADIADTRPDWHIVLVGPTAKMNAAQLPQRANIHYLGNKPYADLPSYLTGWTAAIMPIQEKSHMTSGLSFKTAECLAAGLPVIATPVKAIAAQYEKENLVMKANSAAEFVAATEAILFDGAADRSWMERVNNFLDMSSRDAVTNEILNRLKETMQTVAYSEQVA
ncbi:MAG: glycosyltransferase family 1 protein [Sphingobacteriales bacterium]|nr:MAG: glycosyltransferase family 1 protein [Sphingobacteriales bacterium]